ncbi:hypothetical protein [Brumicola pallidula]|jgi:hypothetical protein|uniref:Uncharacterized protein n=1 Tax=Brumicola pallidula DSM 14239 = ACAM 615 TaxID=1121922 RepID=K6ZVT9_9ALTE|nr:hypothetical protein [Glaciecola pallidula]GAC27440.1 hypothetical protein GPAL_0560 [Glaciecola pallidula DSM 14239 = ACAM 615]
MSIKTWQEDRAEMLREDRREWLLVVAISLAVLASGALLAYLVQGK